MTRSSTPDSPVPEFSSLLADLHACGWSARTDSLPPDLLADLREELQQLIGADALRQAQIGQGADATLRADIRSDRIHWLNGQTPAQNALLQWLEQLRVVLNREFYLGLTELEAHYAHYAPGARYARHLDSFRGNNLRRVTLVLYLNDDWQPGRGGELVLYDGDAVLRRVEPRAGTLVCFLSEQIPHEVLATQVDRYSIAGWFRVRALQG